jgi:hypothetical protein
LQEFPTTFTIFPFKKYGGFLSIIQPFSKDIAEKTLYTLQIFYRVLGLHRENHKLLWGKFVNVIGKTHILYREHL